MNKKEVPMKDPCKSCGIILCIPEENESCVQRRVFLGKPKPKKKTHFRY